jgi:hypothetical protein
MPSSPSTIFSSFYCACFGLISSLGMVKILF